MLFYNTELYDCPKDANGMANIVDPDQTVPSVAD